MIRFAVIEDEKSNSDEMERFLKRYASEKQIEITVSCFSNAVHFLDKYENNFDIVFVDINLPDMDGMTAMKKLRDMDKDVLIIFVTNLAQYAVNGYEVSAFDFIIKPVSYYNLVLKLNRALERLGTKKEKQIWISTRHGKKMVYVSKLRYVEVAKHKITYHTTDGDIEALGALKDVVNELQGLSFVLCNQCYLVNLYYVTGVDDYKCYVGQDILQISSPKKKDFLRALNNYLGGGYK